MIIFLAWIDLIATIIVTGYLISNELDFLIVLLYLISGLIGFVLFLSFGKSILLLLDIRENQFDKHYSINNEKDELFDFEISETKLKELDTLIKKQKKTFLGAGSKSNILILLSKLITSKEKAFIVIDKYNQLFNKDIIEELKGLSSSYVSKREYLSSFIDYKIVANEYPHDLIKE